ncbi:MAG: GDP-mannose 4,6-dehydratase [bacterium]
MPENDYWTNKKVLVTGRAGFVGSHLVEDLIRHGAKVRVVNRLSKSNLDNLKHIKGSSQAPQIQE